MDAATAKYRRVTMATSPVREIVARHGSPTTAEFSSTTQVQELNSSGDEASTDTDLARAASFHQSFWVQGSGSSKGARVLGISETGNDVDVVSKAETWPKPSSRPSRLARVLERVSSKVASFENAPGFS